jgi:endonuclease/exonuclease/phosphatase family metal-dependent hydrolase
MTSKKKFSLRAVFKVGISSLAILITLLLLAVILFYLWAGSSTLAEDKLAEIITFFNPPPSQAEQKTFTVMTYNIGYLSGMTNNQPVIRPKKIFFENNMNTFLHLLNEIQPDFLGFQEIDFHSRRSYDIDQMRTIAERAGYAYAARAVNWDKRYVPFPYWPPAVHFGRMLSGQAVLSRWPILAAQRIVLQKPQNSPFYYNAFYLDRLVQAVKIKAAHREIVILNIHLEAFDRETRENQAKKVLDIYRSYQDRFPTLIIGDFNSVPPKAPQKKNFLDEPETDFSHDQTLQLFLREPGLSAADLTSLTFPTLHPTRKLDYIFYSPEKIELLRTFVLGINSSDHLSVAMQFSIK